MVFTNYRRVLATPGALRFSMTGLVARLPIAMLGIGIVLLVSSATGSYATAGRVSAVYVVANAVFAIVQGRLVDSFGQSKVLPVGALAYAVGLVVLMVAVESDWPMAITYAAAFVSGAPACRPWARASARAGRTCSTRRPRCRPRSRSKRSSTRPCS